MAQTRQISDRQRLDWLRLIRSENVGPVTFRQLLARYGDPGAALEALPDLARRGGLRRAIRVCPEAAAAREIEALARLGGRMVALVEPGYPGLLAHLADAPPVLSVLGHPHVLESRMVAMVGARNGSANGCRIARTMAAELGQAGLTVDSGLARGIDAASHQGALATGTVAVMAGGVDVIYPRENEALYGDIKGAGAVISEHPLGLKPQARHFPYRNRIVSGLALATVVIEATLRSGSLITARLAGEQGRDVLAVPGNPLDARARGTNRLIRDGATLVEDAGDVLEAIQPTLGGPVAEPAGPEFLPGPATGDETAALDEARRRVEELLGAAPTGIDEILRQSGLSPRILATVILELELAGRLSRHPGGQVSLAFNH